MRNRLSDPKTNETTTNPSNGRNTEMATPTPGWRSAKAEQKFRVADEARWAKATEQPPNGIDITTSFGSTRVHHWPGPGSDIVFLHGLGDTSFRWLPYAEALADHNVYAVDTMGEPGLSIPAKPFEAADDYGVWLVETIEGLGLSQPHVVGHSMGGYVALSYATQGGHASSLVLFDPVGVVELRLFRFLLWNAMVVAGALSPGPLNRWFARRLRHPVLSDKDDFGVVMQAQRGHPAKPMPLPVFTDEQLAAVNPPVHLVVGAKSSAFDVDKMVRRIADLGPHCTARLVADAGHAVPQSHLDDCVAAIRTALDSGVSTT